MPNREGCKNEKGQTDGLYQIFSWRDEQGRSFYHANRFKCKQFRMQPTHSIERLSSFVLTAEELP
jgi:hypothetical protein